MPPWCCHCSSELHVLVPKFNWSILIGLFTKPRKGYSAYYNGMNRLLVRLIMGIVTLLVMSPCVAVDLYSAADPDRDESETGSKPQTPALGL